MKHFFYTAFLLLLVCYLHAADTYNIIDLKQEVGEIFAAAFSLDGTILILDADLGKELRVLEGHTNRIVAAAFLSEEKVSTISADSTVRIWTLE